MTFTLLSLEVLSISTVVRFFFIEVWLIYNNILAFVS